MNNKEIFTGRSNDYSRCRPSYPDSAVEWLRNHCSGDHVVDVGAGTGIFTKVLLRCFKNVCAVEPNADMRESFHTFLPEIPCFDASGESTGLEKNSIDLITVAQAFHWLDEEKFREEACRILRPQGKVAIIWNTCLQNDFIIARNQVCQKYCPRFRAGYAGKRPVAEGDDFLRYHYFRKVEVASFNNPFPMTQDIFEGNMRSRSYTLYANHSDYADFMKELRSVFDKYAINGVVTEPQETQIYLGTFE